MAKIDSKDFTSNIIRISRLSPVTKDGPIPKETRFAVFTFEAFFDITGFSRQDNISFTWFYYDNVEKNNWVQMVNTINATIYFIPHKPNLPWMVSGNEPNYDKTQNPWIDALDMLLEWGVKNKNDVVEIAIQITEHVNLNLNLKYATNNKGRSSVTSGDIFDCSIFISNLANLKPDKIPPVNCTDCATVVSTFANLLGANLYQTRFGGYSLAGFDCNKVIVIGETSWKYPFEDIGGKGFSYHEIAFLGERVYTNKIFDACLKVNQNAANNPNASKVALLPSNQQFAALSDWEYKEDHIKNLKSGTLTARYR